MRLARETGPERLEAACARALSIDSPTYRSVESILDAELDRHDTSLLTGARAPMPEHENVRGPSYYGRSH